MVARHRPAARRGPARRGADEQLGPARRAARCAGPSDLGFDTVVESAVEGIRKPDPRIYELVCERLDVTPHECVFLDDLGVNLKPARAMGMTTIKVDRRHATRWSSSVGTSASTWSRPDGAARHPPRRAGSGDRRRSRAARPADPELTARGRDQAARLGDWLGAEGVDHVVSSPLRRATETAAPLAAALGLDVAIDDQLCEYDANADSYIPIEELRELKDDRWQAMVEGRWEDFGGEAPDVFRARIVDAARRASSPSTPASGSPSCATAA